MEWVAVLIAAGTMLFNGILATVAWGRANEAREARDEAKQHLEAVKLTAAAADRSAVALERQAAAAESGVRRDPWVIEKAGAHRWKVTNRTGHNVDFVMLRARGRAQIDVESADHCDVDRGASVFFHFGGALTDPASATVEISWRDPFTRMQESFVFTI